MGPAVPTGGGISRRPSFGGSVMVMATDAGGDVFPRATTTALAIASSSSSCVCSPGLHKTVFHKWSNGPNIASTLFSNSPTNAGVAIVACILDIYLQQQFNFNIFYAFVLFFIFRL
jgi:hypothetical protein